MSKFMIARILICLMALALPAPGRAQTAPTFVGVRTFLSAPYEPDLDKLHADFAVLGVPFDEGTWGQPGERYGPRDMRENSQEYAHDLTEGFYYVDGDRTVLKGKRWVDVGDVIVYPTVPAETDEKITEAYAFERLLRRAAKRQRVSALRVSGKIVSSKTMRAA